MTLRVTARFFASYREKVGKNQLEMEIPLNSTLADLNALVQRRFPELTIPPDCTMLAVNAEYAEPGQMLKDGDEVAFIPPVSGGGMVQVTEAELVPERIVENLKKASYGAVVTFLGIVRDFSDGRELSYLEYEAYPEMAEKKLSEIALDVKKRWQLEDVALYHRTGKLRVGEVSLVVAVASPHRREAFEACQYAVDRLKERVPIWKKEVWKGGSAWVESDHH